MTKIPFHAARVLISYQRGDDDERVRRLTQYLGTVTEIRPVVTCYDYSPTSLLNSLDTGRHSPIVLVVIGKDWAEKVKAAYRRRGPLVAYQAILKAKRSVIIPVVVGEATLPPFSFARPPSFLETRIESESVSVMRDDHWREDFARLVETLRQVLTIAGKGPPPTVRATEIDRTLYEQRYRKRVPWKGSPRHDDDLSLPGTDIFKSKNDVQDAVPSGAVKAAARESAASRTSSTRPPGTPDILDKLKDSTADLVACTAFAPQTVAPGGSFMLQVFAHLPADADAAARLAKEADEEAEKRGSKTLDSEVERGEKITFDLQAPGMEVDDPVQYLVWRGSPEAVRFGVTADETLRPGNVICTVTVSVRGVPFGSLKFKLKVAAESKAGASGGEPQAEQSWARFRKAFISYASKDRDEVLKRVQMLAGMKIEFFQDLLSLEPGERWDRALYKHIDESDVFYLFWSTAAKESKWVLEEVRYALKRRGGDEFAPPEIIPVIIEGPPHVAPPPELSFMHFNDKILYFIGK